MNKKKGEKVFYSVSEIRKHYFPKSFKKMKQEIENEKPKAFGSGLAKEILEDIRQELMV